MHCAVTLNVRQFLVLRYVCHFILHVILQLVILLAFYGLIQSF